MSVCWAPIQSVLLYKSVMDTADWDTSYISIVIQVTATTQSLPSTTTHRHYTEMEIHGAWLLGLYVTLDK